ncbi:MAG: hypothetical protein HON90_13405 [Halobacteriovoraceae bacterium]|nr:hypothetical protein [Halobacteriovoraceae bacterium]
MISKFSIMLAIIFIIGVSGCSSLVESTRKSMTGETSPRKVKKEVKWVSKSQYDGLMNKYKDLSKKYENLKDNKVGASSRLDELDKGVHTETIDVFGKNGITQKSKAISVKNDQKKVNQELEYYKKALALKQNNKTEEALKVFQFLEGSKVKQIYVRAKKNIGDIYFEKSQFDLALQVYESIIRQSSYSGIVIKALERAGICSEKLGLTEKKLKYESILRDFFEVRV